MVIASCTSQLLFVPHHFYVIPKLSLAEYIKGQSGSLSGGDGRFSGEYSGRGCCNNLLLQPSPATFNVGKLFYFAWFRHDIEMQDSIFHLTITENEIRNRMWVS